MKKILILIVISASFIWSCKKNTDDSSTVDLTYNYFPVNIGHTLIYDVDSLVYDDNTGHTTIDTFTYQYKEIVSENIIDDEGKPAQKLLRFFRKHDTDIWQSVNTWIESRSNLNAQKVEENIRYVKLVFPLNATKNWNRNAYNNLGENIFSVDYFDQPFTVNGTVYDKTLKIKKDSSINAIEEIRGIEIYARNVGLIYFQSDSINTQPNAPPSTGTKSRGFRYRLKLKSYQ